jgi:hypothetical protein
VFLNFVFVKCFKIKTIQQASANRMLLEVLPTQGVASDSSSSPRTPALAVVLEASSKIKVALCSEVKLNRILASEAHHQAALEPDKLPLGLEEPALDSVVLKLNNNRAHSLVSEAITMLLKEEACLVEINKSRLVADFLVRIPKVPPVCHLVSNQINLKALADNKIKPQAVGSLELTSSKTI